MSLPSRRPSLAEEVLPAGRPFLPDPSRATSVEVDSSASSVGVRAYLMTGGRATAQLEFETMLSAQTVARPKNVRFERAAILDVCSTRPISLAEISAYIHIPIGVVRVLAADLLSEGFLKAYGGPADKMNDVTLLTKLINGVRAL
jgi:hypothetical protein